MNTEEVYKLSEEQEIKIEKSRKEIESGNFHKNDKVISEMREWLKKK